jgi:hypothetical protein
MIPLVTTKKFWSTQLTSVRRSCSRIQTLPVSGVGDTGLEGVDLWVRDMDTPERALALIDTFPPPAMASSLVKIRKPHSVLTSVKITSQSTDFSSLIP